MKVAIVHDWLTNLGGAERVVAELHEQYPAAPIYTSVHDPEALPAFTDFDIRTTWLQSMPFARFKHQLWVPLRPKAFRDLKLEGYDAVISSSSAESKQIKAMGAKHFCYCHTPIRYFWSQYEHYKKNPGLGILNPFANIVMPLFIYPLRRSDYKAAQKVDHFIANSTTVQKRIKKYYNRDSVVIHPPVDVERFRKTVKSERSGFVVAGRQIPYKRFDLAIAACNKLGLDLTVVGNGPEHNKLRAMAGPTIRFETSVSDAEMPSFFHHAKGFIFAAEEDFGIVPVEAMAAGCPVVAYGKGGVTDSVQSGLNGVFFEKQTVPSLVDALVRFERRRFNETAVAKTADKFNAERFRLEIHEYVSGIVH